MYIELLVRYGYSIDSLIFPCKRLNMFIYSELKKRIIKLFKDHEMLSDEEIKYSHPELYIHEPELD
tara:strand:+ start:328 stop:525 length:198 start_codon:yes stop_codon:yes gene_type:complete